MAILVGSPPTIEPLLSALSHTSTTSSPALPPHLSPFFQSALAGVLERCRGQLEAGDARHETAQGGALAGVEAVRGLDVDQAVAVGVDADERGRLRDVGLRRPADVDGVGGVPVVLERGRLRGGLAHVVPAEDDQEHADGDDAQHGRVPEPGRAPPRRTTATCAGRPGHLLAARRLTHGLATLAPPATYPRSAAALAAPDPAPLLGATILTTSPAATAGGQPPRCDVGRTPEAQHRPVMGHHHPVRGPGGGHALHVHDSRRRLVAGGPAGPAQPASTGRRPRGT